MTSKFSRFATKRQPIIGALRGLCARNGKKSNVYTCSSLFIRIVQICNRSSPSIHQATKAGIISKMFFGVQKRGSRVQPASRNSSGLLNP